ncbi:MAG: helicase C-terminal domain-containing protein [Nanoarchaeota archaeon]
MVWSLYNKEGEFLQPLKFSNKKTQEDVVNEIVSKIKKGEKIIFIRGVCGTGKSGIALNIAKELGKTSVVVPGKNLQAQYKADYEINKYLLKNSKKKLNISVMTGRKNHKCKFLEEQKNIPLNKKSYETDKNLLDIFSNKKKKEKTRDFSANNPNIPCKIEIKKRNIGQLKEYIKQNPNVNVNNFNEIQDVKRASVAAACPYWSPVLPEKYELKNFPEKNKFSYVGIDNKNFVVNCGKPGCKFYEQYLSYVNSDVIVFNSLKYKLESALGRKPMTEVEIIDECDEFLDSFSNQRSININRLQNSLINLFGINENAEDVIDELLKLIKHFKKDKRIDSLAENGNIIELKKTGIYDMIKLILKNPQILDEIDPESYLVDVEETSRMFEGFLNESYMNITKKDELFIVNIVTTNLAKRFKEMVRKNKSIVLMSGTLHSEQVLRDIFGLEKFTIVDAETSNPGKIEIRRTGLEKDCKYSNFSQGNHTRKDYLDALESCLKEAPRPTLVHVNSFGDLPNEKEKEEFNLKNLISRQELKEEQFSDNTGEIVKEFKSGERDIFFSTRASRGMDFPGEQCRSIIFTKYPNPDVKDAFWRILHKTHPGQYWEFYKDKASRELFQKLYRGLRFKEDFVFVLSPDSRVLNVLETHVTGKNS